MTKSRHKPVVALSMRVTNAPHYDESRDAISQDWIRRLDAWNMIPMLIPNTLRDPIAFLDKIQPDLLILTGGDDIGATPDRDQTETALFFHAFQEGPPVLGICRGLQIINALLGGSLGQVEGHVGINHSVAISPLFSELYGKKTEVNSYHDTGVKTDGLAKELLVTATDADDNIEAFCHKEKAVAAVMWHPERNSAVDGDRILVTNLIKNGAFWN